MNQFLARKPALLRLVPRHSQLEGSVIRAADVMRTSFATVKDDGEKKRHSPEYKMSKLKIPHNAFVFVGDGRKALFLRNEGDEKFPNLKTEQVFEDENPLTHEQGSERPGRVSKALDSGQRSAVEPVDWHHIEERRFARKVAAAMEQVVRARRAPALVVVAPPKTLVELRGTFHDDVKSRIIAEINKDLTKHTVVEIEKHITSAARVGPSSA